MSAVRELPLTALELSFEIVTVTPDLAEKWLGKNVKNRHISQRVVDKYAKAMAAGEWLLDGESIKFAVNGDLIDGQHRLKAVMESDRSISTFVVRGIPSVAQTVIDTGRARTAGDALGIAGFADSSNLAASARACILYEAGLLGMNSNVSHTATLTFVSGNSMLAFAVARARTISRGSGLRPAIAAMTFYELMKVDDEAAQEFFDRLADGVSLSSGSPILALRARLRTLKDERTALPPEALVSLVFRTWNAWRAKRSLASLPLYRQGELIACPVPK